MFRVLTWLEHDLPSFQYFRKIKNSISSKRQGSQKIITFIFINTMQHPRILKNYVNHSTKRGPPLWIPILYLTPVGTNRIPIMYFTTLWFILSTPCFGCNNGINLVAVLEYTFFQLCSNVEQIQVQKNQKKLCKPPCGRSNQPLSKLHCLFCFITAVQNGQSFLFLHFSFFSCPQ